MARRTHLPRRKIASRVTKPRAATTDILGKAGKPAAPRIPARWKEHFQRLVELREGLLSRRAASNSTARQAKPSFSSHMADAGTDTFDRDFALGMLSSEQDAVYEIEEAIDRIRNGNYGLCELTRKKIEPARLKAIPWTRFSAEAERELEKEGSFKRAKLGDRESVVKVTASLSDEDE